MRGKDSCMARRLLLLLPIAWLVGMSQPAHAVIVITEVMYHPAGGGQDLEFIEILNETTDPMDITGYYFSEGVSFTFLDRTILSGGEYLVVAADAARIQDTYGITNVVGNWNPNTALANGGERISLSNPAGVVEATVRYNDRGKWPSGADGTGHSLELRDPYLELDDPDHWELSGVLGGSPGLPNNTEEGALPVVVNEALFLVSEGERWVELYNKGDTPLDLTGYYLSTDRAGGTPGRLPFETVIEPRGWLSFSESELGLDFTPDADDRTFVALWNPQGTRVIDARIFEVRIPDLSEARIPDGDESFSSAAEPTRGAANRVDVLDDVVINEILYHPYDRDRRYEFVELYNRGAEVVQLTGWGFCDGIEFQFPPGATLAPDSYIVVAPYPEHIVGVYGLPANQVYGPRDEESRARFAVLSDQGERVTLCDDLGNTVDTVRYYDGGEWPGWADGGGSSMELIDPFQDNSVGQAWDSSDDSADSPVKEYTYKGTYSSGEGEFHLVVPGGGITLVDDIKFVTETIGVEEIEVYREGGDGYRYYKGVTEPSDPIDLWRQPDFDDSGWLQGAGIIGYGESDTDVVLDDMRDSYTSIYVRAEFQVADPSSVESLILDVEYDDGYVAYLNGTEVVVTNMPDGLPTHDVEAVGAKEGAEEQVDLTDHKDLLQAGRNVLAIQVHNSSIRSSDVRLKSRILNGRFVPTESDNLIVDGTFEEPDLRRNWLIEGTHIRSGQTTVEPLSGNGSLKIVSTGGGDNKVNRIETSNAGMPRPLPRVEYTISFLARWIVGSPTLLTHGAYIGSAAPSYATSHRLEIAPRPGTPGEINSVSERQITLTGSPNLGPMIEKVDQDPALPAADQPVTVRAKVHDPDGVAAVMLHYSLDTPRPPESGLVSLPMAGPDADGYYAVEVPGQSLRRKVVFYITATDAGGRAGRWPLDHLSRTHPLVLDPENASVNEARYAVYRHDSPHPLSKQSYRVWMHTANESILNSRRKLSNDYLEGSMVFNNRDIYHSTAVRFAGSPWTRPGNTWSNVSYRVKMPSDNPLHGSIESYNMEDHQRNGGQDGRERLSHYLFRWCQGQSVMPYSLQWLVRFQVNDRVTAIREHVQTPNPQFIDRWWPDDDDGAFFEMDDRFEITDQGTKTGNQMDGRLLYPPYGSPAFGEDKEFYRYFFNPRLDRHLDDFSELIKFAKLMTSSQTRNDEFDEKVWGEVDVEQLCRNWAIRLNTDDWDTWGANRGKNCYLYRPRLEGQWHNIPWDMELTYGSVGAFMPPPLTATSNPTYQPGSKFPEVTRFINRPPIKRMYYGIMKEMIDGYFRSDFLEPWVTASMRAGVTRLEAARPGGFIDQRRTQLVSRVRGVTTAAVDFAVTTNGGQPLQSPTRTVTISGVAPVEIFQIWALKDGEDFEMDVEFSRTSVVGWSATGELPLGTSTLLFEGYDSRLGFVDSVEYEVTVSIPEPPSITRIFPLPAVIGDPVVINGENILRNPTVLFGDVEATTVTFDPDVNATMIQAVVPADAIPGPTEVRIVNFTGQESEPYPVQVIRPAGAFLRGDSNLDGALNLTDAVDSLNYQFKGGPEPGCLDALDANDDGELNLTDPVVILQHLFLGGTPPAEPYPTAGLDPTPEDGLECDQGLQS